MCRYNRAGIQTGDVIVRINELDAATSEDVKTAMNRDQELNMTVLREDRTMVLRIDVEELGH